MSTLEILKKAKNEIEKAISAQNTIIVKTFDTKEYQFSQMGRVAALLDIAIMQEGGYTEKEQEEEEEEDEYNA